MAFVQRSLSGMAASWFLRLHESYKNDCSSFVSALEKHLFAQKTAFYAQDEAQALIQKQIENVLPYAVKVQRSTIS